MAIVVALFGFGGGVAHAITFSSTDGPYVAPTGPQALSIDFNNGLPKGVTLSGDYAIDLGTTGINAEPYGDTTPYLSVPSIGSSGSAILDFGRAIKATEVSLYWGSIDAYNTLSFLDGSTVIGSFSGSLFPPANGDQTSYGSNKNVHFFLGGQTITGLKFDSNGYAFESDNITVGVPEPATWALLLTGFFGLGGLLRIQRHYSWA
jgi:hypothetical protein